MEATRDGRPRLRSIRLLSASTSGKPPTLLSLIGGERGGRVGPEPLVASDSGRRPVPACSASTKWESHLMR